MDLLSIQALYTVWNSTFHQPIALTFCCWARKSVTKHHNQRLTFFTEDKDKNPFANIQYFPKETSPPSDVLFVCWTTLLGCSFHRCRAIGISFFFFNVFKMATGTGTAALPPTTTSPSPRSPSGSLWPFLTTTLCPCPPTRMQLTRSCPSKRGRSLGWGFMLLLVFYTRC